MNLPKSFQMANRTWKIKYWPKLELDQLASQDGPVWGIADPVRAEIGLSDALSDTADEFHLQTLLHEVVHAAMFSLGYGTGEGPHTEPVVDGLSAMLAQALLTKKGTLGPP